MGKDVTIKQHFVPRFYLKNFADEKGYLQIYDKRNLRLCVPKAYQAVGFEKFFYAAKTGKVDDVSQHIEDWLGAFEKPISENLPRVIEVILENQHVTDQDKNILSVFMSLLWLRSPQMRRQLALMETDLRKQQTRWRAPEIVEHFKKETNRLLSEEQENYLTRMIEEGRYDIHYDNIQHLRFMTKELGAGKQGFSNLFYAAPWKIYITKGVQRFVTTDSPVSEWFLPPTTIYGTSFIGRYKYFALTPEILIEVLPFQGANRGKPIKRETIYVTRDDKVHIFNMLLAGNAHSYVYTGDKNIAKQLVEAAQNPGKLEKEYYKKYEHPWVEHDMKMRNTEGELYAKKRGKS